MNILIVSSLPPSWCSNLGYNMIQRFLALGHNVDFLSKDEPDTTEPWMHFVYKKQNTQIKTHNNETPIIIKKSLMSKFRDFTISAKSSFRDFLLSFYKPLEIPPLFSIIDETKPLVPIEDFKKALPDQIYDKIYILFWWGMLSSLNIKVLLEKYDCEIFISNIDMSPMTGACYYFGDCEQYKNECKKCPVTRLSRYSSIPHKNFLFKKAIYQSPKIKFLANNWSAKRYLESELMKPDQIIISTIHIDDKLYKPLDIFKTREELGLPHDKFIFFCGAANPKEPRKGFKFLISALDLFVKNTEIASNCLLLIAGGNIDIPAKMETRHIGKLTPEALAKYYAASDAFLSPSVDDAGPSMVNQSIMCGTPVVAFSVGTAEEDVITSKTGYLAKYREPEDFCRGMLYLYNFRDKLALRKSCREYAIKAFNQPLKTL